MPGDCRLDSGACMNGRSCVIIILTLLLTCMMVTRPVAAYTQPDISSWINSYTHVINFGNDSNGYASSMSYANETLAIDHDLEIDQGTSIKMDNVTLVMNGTSNGSLKIEVLDGGSLYLNNSSIITNGPAYNIYIYNNGTFDMKGTTIKGCGYQGLDPQSYGLWINSNNNRIEGNTIEDGDYGLVFDHSNNNLLANNTIRRNKVGFYFISSMSNTITRDVINDNGEGGLIAYSYNNILSDNVIINNTGPGIAIGPASDVNFLKNNTICGNGQGIMINASLSNSMVSNRIEQNVGPAIWLESSQVNFIGNNILSSNSYGLYLNSSDENVLSGNNASFNHADGVYLGTSSNNYIANNNAS